MPNEQNNLNNKKEPEEVARLLGKENAFRFTCTACGDCCRTEGSVYFTREDLDKIYAHLKLTEDKRKALHKKLIQRRNNNYYIHDSQGPCILLDLETNRCKAYPARPLQCRSFPFWPSVFHSKADFRQTQHECPGMQSLKGQAFLT